MLLKAGDALIEADLGYTHFSELTMDGRPQPDYRERLRVYEGQLAVTYAVTARFSEALILPAALIQYEREFPLPWRRADPRARGFGDALLLGRYLLLTRPLRLLLSGGISIPTGSLGFSAEGAVSGASLGSGTVDPIASLEAYLPLGSVGVSASVGARLPYRFTADGDQASRTVFGALGVGYALGRSVSAGFSLDAGYRSRTVSEGAVEIDTGGRSLGIGPTLAWAPTSSTTVTATLRIPLASVQFGTQLNPAFALAVGLSCAVGGGPLLGPSGPVGPESALRPGISKGDPAAAGRPLDVLSVRPSGIAGKVTVIDLWAAWCLPCQALAASLSALALEHPALAIVWVDVSDSDGEAFRTLVGNGSLPRVIVYRPDGTLAAEQSGSPAELLTAVRAALAEAPR